MNLTQLLSGFRSTKLVNNAHSAAGVACADTSAIRAAARQVASGALTANTVKTVLSVTGAGEFGALALHVVDGTSRTLRLRVWVDNVLVFDTTSAANTTVNNGLIAAGPFGTGPNMSPPIRFGSSCVVEVASSVTETDKLVLDYLLNTVN